MDEYGTYTTVLYGKAYRIVAYPQGSPLAGNFCCYCDGRYTGVTVDFAAAKAWCLSWADGTSSPSVDMAAETGSPS